MNALTLLAANNVEWFRLVIPLVFLAIYLINQVVGKARANGPQPAKRQPPRRPGPPPSGRPQPAAQEPAPNSLSNEIEQFLKDAAQRKRDKGRREPQRPGPAPSRPASGSGRQQPVRTLVRSVAEEAVDIVPIEPPTGQGVSDGVQRNLDVGAFATRASHLTDDIKRADAQREQHFNRQFTHKVGRLDDTSAQQPELNARDTVEQAAQTALAGDIASLLTQPADLRRAIVLAEILERPEKRW